MFSYMPQKDAIIYEINYQGFTLKQKDMAVRF
jgi:hypothetical protein